MEQKDPLVFLSSLISAELNNQRDLFLSPTCQTNISNLGKNCLDIHTTISNTEERLTQYLNLYQNIFLSSTTPKSLFYLTICNKLINKSFLITNNISNEILLHLENQECSIENLDSHINYIENNILHQENQYFSLKVIKSPSSDKIPHNPTKYNMSMQWSFALQDNFKLKQNKSTKIIFTNQGDHVTIHQLAKIKYSDVAYIEIQSKEIKLWDTFEIRNVSIVIQEIFEEKLKVLIKLDFNSYTITISESTSLKKILSEYDFEIESHILIFFKKQENSWLIQNENLNYPLYLALLTTKSSENPEIYPIYNIQKIKLLDYIFEAEIK